MRFKKGDYVKVRRWKDMENEFGLSPSGYINTYCYFVNIMRFLCGKILYIKHVNILDYYTTLLPSGKKVMFCISDDMLEPRTYSKEEFENQRRIK